MPVVVRGAPEYRRSYLTRPLCCSMRKYPSSSKLSAPINLFANQAFYRCRNGRVLRLEPIEQIHLVGREFKIDLLGFLALILRACPFLRLACCHDEPSFPFCLFGLFEAWAFSGVPLYTFRVFWAMHFTIIAGNRAMFQVFFAPCSGAWKSLWYEADEQTCSRSCGTPRPSNRDTAAVSTRLFAAC